MCRALRASCMIHKGSPDRLAYVYVDAIGTCAGDLIPVRQGRSEMKRAQASVGWDLVLPCAAVVCWAYPPCWFVGCSCLRHLLVVWSMRAPFWSFWCLEAELYRGGERRFLLSCCLIMTSCSSMATCLAIGRSRFN